MWPFPNYLNSNLLWREIFLTSGKTFQTVANLHRSGNPSKFWIDKPKVEISGPNAQNMFGENQTQNTNTNTSYQLSNFMMEG